MTAVVDFLNTVFWGYVLVYGLLAVGVYYTLRLGFIQFRRIGEFFRVVTLGPSGDQSGISPFQALSVSLASRVGTGNLAGVAVALTLGGPGAIFWMWLVALLGMATAYAEATLAQLYKVKNDNGRYRGGPGFYMSRGLGQRWMGVVFSLALILSFGFVFSAVQANTIADAANVALGVPKFGTGLAIAALVALVIFGGIRKIAQVAQYVVPIMAGLYLLLALFVVVMNLSQVPATLWLIVSSAFGIEEAAGGVTGGVMAALLNGVKRGLFSNEAGMGSAPNIAANATPEPHHPVSQGMVQGLGPLIDTVIVCTATALLILLSGIYEPNQETTGIALTQLALAEHVGDFGQYFVAVGIFFFAFTSIIGNYSYAENALTYLGLSGKTPLMIVRVLVLAMVVWGALQSVQTVFDTADAAMGLMATVNLVAIVLLSGTVIKLTRDYFDQRAAGKEPQFIAADHPELRGKVDPEIWTHRTPSQPTGARNADQNT